MTDWPLPATRGTTLGLLANNLKTSLRASLVRKALVEDIEWMKETGESPQRAALRLGKTRSALERSMRTSHRNDLANWLNRVMDANCEDCDKPIRGRTTTATYSGLCTKCAVHRAKAS